MGIIDEKRLKNALMKKTINEQETKSNDFVKIMEMLLHSRNQVHIYHLQTKSFSEHSALNTYYDSIGDLFDGLVESYQGKYGIIGKYECDGFDSYSSNEQVVNYFKKMTEEIEDLRQSVKESYLQNQIDGVVELIYSTIYKLVNLK